MPEGLEIVDVSKPECKPNEIAAAEYEIVAEFSDDGEAQGFVSGAKSIIDGGVLNAEKRSKKGIKTVNLCELIRKFDVENVGKNIHINTILAAGNTVNLNAELLFSSLLSQLAAESERVEIVRTKLLREDLSIFE